jgi:molecular chaperone DnaK
LAGEVTDVLLLDVTPLSLGIETLAADDDPHLAQHDDPVAEERSLLDGGRQPDQRRSARPAGRGPLARDNRTLGRFQLTGVPPSQRGVPQIEVAFDIDANGIVSVTAKDTATAKEQKITISGASGLSKDEVDRMVKEASSHASEDSKRRELIDVRNQADSLAYQVEKTIGENREKRRSASCRRSKRRLPSPAGRADRRRRRNQESGRRTAARLARYRAGAIRERLVPVVPAVPRVPVVRQVRSSGVKDGEVVDAEYAETA